MAGILDLEVSMGINKTMIEIERKWIMRALPTIDRSRHFTIEQAYLSVCPEVRITRKTSVESSMCEMCKLTIKSPCSIKRNEIEFELSEEQFEALLGLVNAEAIQKDYSVASVFSNALERNVDLHMGVVDKNLHSKWMYAEVEFDSLEDAGIFKIEEVLHFPKMVELEATGLVEWSMAEYWRKTRKV
jgi:hypothetical protein